MTVNVETRRDDFAQHLPFLSSFLVNETEGEGVSFLRLEKN